MNTQEGTQERKSTPPVCTQVHLRSVLWNYVFHQIFIDNSNQVPILVSSVGGLTGVLPL